MKAHLWLVAIVLVSAVALRADWFEVKSGVSAIVREAPNGDAAHVGERLDPGTKVEKLGEAPRYWSIRLPDGRVGWSYKANFVAVAGAPTLVAAPVTKESLMARTDLLQIVVLDVEVGDATLILCPQENGTRDVILIDTGENDSDRIAKELISHGFVLSNRPITRFIATHYDFDHIGNVAQIVPWTQTVYDHGNNNVKPAYLTAVTAPGVDRRTMTLNYDETFSGGVKIECVAVIRRNWRIALAAMELFHEHLQGIGVNQDCRSEEANARILKAVREKSAALLADHAKTHLGAPRAYACCRAVWELLANPGAASRDVRAVRAAEPLIVQSMVRFLVRLLHVYYSQGPHVVDVKERKRLREFNTEGRDMFIVRREAGKETIPVPSVLYLWALQYEMSEDNTDIGFRFGLDDVKPDQPTA